jgi:hypothetical protein
MAKGVSRSGQGELFERSARARFQLDENHRLVRLTEVLDWTALEALAQAIRREKLKSRAGRPPRLRPLLGAVVFMSTRRITYREAEDFIRHYGPARYLCGLTDSDWTPDFTTVQDFLKLMGEEGLRRINEFVVKVAVDEKLADPSEAVADTTAQEAAVPYPNEIGLLSTFLTSVLAASRKGGRMLRQVVAHAGATIEAARQEIREYRLFAKERSKAAKDRMTARVVTLVSNINRQLGDGLKQVSKAGRAPVGVAKVAQAKLRRLHETMQKLIPQIRYWLRTGFVASDKIISIQIPELYSVVRGKVGKKVEFGLNWGVTRLKGGFLLALRAADRRELVDAKYAVLAVEKLRALFGKAPRAYAYDRGGYSAANVHALRKLGVRKVGLAPRGRAEWGVDEKTRRRLSSERAQIEGGIGTIKSARYGFNRPPARSVAAMATSGQRALLGFNLNKLVREMAAREEVTLTGA